MEFLYTNYEIAEKETKRAILFTITTKDSSSSKLTKEVNDLYKENYKTQMKEIKDNT